MSLTTDECRGNIWKPTGDQSEHVHVLEHLSHGTFGSHDELQE